MTYSGWIRKFVACLLACTLVLSLTFSAMAEDNSTSGEAQNTAQPAADSQRGASDEKKDDTPSGSGGNGATDSGGSTNNTNTNNSNDGRTRLAAAGVKLSVPSGYILAGSTVRLKASVSTKNGTPTGTFTFKANDAVIASDMSAASGGATVNWTPSTAGSYVLLAQYVPGANDRYQAGAASKSVTVQPKPQPTEATRTTPPPVGNASNETNSAANNTAPNNATPNNAAAGNPSTVEPTQPQGDTNNTNAVDNNANADNGALDSGATNNNTVNSDNTNNNTNNDNTNNTDNNNTNNSDTDSGGATAPANAQPSNNTQSSVQEADAAQSDGQDASALQSLLDARVSSRHQGEGAVDSQTDDEPNAPGGDQDGQTGTAIVSGTLGLSVSGPESVRAGDEINLTVRVTTPDGGEAPIGTISLGGSQGLESISAGTQVSGGFAFTAKVTATEGDVSIVATYVGDDYTGTTSKTISVTASPNAADAGDDDDDEPEAGVALAMPMMMSMAIGLNSQLPMSIRVSPSAPYIGGPLTATVVADISSGLNPTGTIALTGTALVNGTPTTLSFGNARAFSNGQAVFSMTGVLPAGTTTIDLTATYTQNATNPNDYLGNTKTETVTVGMAQLTSANTNITLTSPGLQPTTYTPGSTASTPAPIVQYYNGSSWITLTNGTHYTYTVTPPASVAGTYTYTITAIPVNGYSGEAIKTFTINPMSISTSNGSVRVNYGTYIATNPIVPVGTAFAPTLEWWNGTAWMPMPAADYDLSYSVANHSEPGPKTLTITGKDNCTGTRTISYKQGSTTTLIDAMVSPTTIPPQQYTGQQIRPAITVTDGAQVLQEGVHYQVTYPNAVYPNAPTGYTVAITGIAPYYSGTIYRTFTIVQSGTLKTNLALSVDGTLNGQQGKDLKLNVTLTSVWPQGTINAGTVTFSVDGVDQLPSVSVTGPSATITIPAASLTPGSHTVSARYTGVVGSFDDSAQVSKTVMTSANAYAQPQLQITGGTNGQNLEVTLILPVLSTATTPPGAPIPASAVFSDGTHTYTADTVTTALMNGQYVGIAKLIIPASSLQVGRTYTFTAQYTPGDANYAATSVLSKTYRIGQNVPQVVLSVRGGLNGTTARINVVVKALPGGPTPTGYVVIHSNGRVVDRLPLNAYGEVSLTWTNVPYDAYQLSAYYEGDTYYDPAASAIVTLNSGDGAYTTSVSVEAKMDRNNKNATLSATVADRWWNPVYNRFETYPYYNTSGMYVGPTGWVSFYADGKLLDTIRLDKGVATMTWKSVPVGTHTILAVYSGDVNFSAGRASVALTRKSGSSSSSGSITASTSTTAAGQGITLRDVTGNTVEVFDVSTAPLVDGMLTLQTARDMDTYSFGIPLSQFARQNEFGGYFNFVTPRFNLHVPFDLVTYMEGLSEFLNDNRFNDNQMELRVTVERVSSSAVPTDLSGLEGSVVSNLYRVTVTLHDAIGSKYSFTPGEFGAPMRLLIPRMPQADSAMYYDETTGMFVPVGIGQSDDGAAVITVDLNGIYAAMQGGK